MSATLRSMKISHDSETPAHGQQVITAVALIHHSFDGVTKVFLPKRADTKKFLPGIFELPGGHIDFGENIVAGLQREIQEELGVRIKVGDPFAAFDYTNDVKGSHSVQVIYFATLIDPPENITLNFEDHSEYAWISSNEQHTVNNTPEEKQVVAKAFKLLEGEPLNFGV